MKPTKVPITDKQIDLFRPELSKIIDPRHSLVKLSRVVNWDDLDNTFGITFCDDNGRPGKPEAQILIDMKNILYKSYN